MSTLRKKSEPTKCCLIERKINEMHSTSPLERIRERTLSNAFVWQDLNFIDYREADTHISNNVIVTSIQ